MTNQITTEVMKDRADRIQWCEQGHSTSGATDLVYIQRNPGYQPKLVCRDCSKELAVQGWRILPF